MTASRSLSQAAQQLLDSYIKDLEDIGYTANSINTYRRHLARFMHHHETRTRKPFDAATLTGEQIKQHLLAEVGGLKLKTATVKQELETLKKFCAWLESKGIVERNPAARIRFNASKSDGTGSATAKPEKVDIHLRLTPELYANLQRVTPKGKSVQQTMINAARAMLDESADIQGSRRYFTGKFADAVQDLDLNNQWMHVTTLLLLADIGSILIRNLIKLDAKELEESYTAIGLLNIAQDLVVNHGYAFREAFLQAIFEARYNELEIRTRGLDAEAQARSSPAQAAAD